MRDISRPFDKGSWGKLVQLVLESPPFVKEGGEQSSTGGL